MNHNFNPLGRKAGKKLKPNAVPTIFDVANCPKLIIPKIRPLIFDCRLIRRCHWCHLKSFPLVKLKNHRVWYVLRLYCYSYFSRESVYVVTSISALG